MKSENWKTVRLGDVCEIPITDGTHQTPTYAKAENGIPFLSSKDVTTQTIDWNNIKYITKELHETLYKRISPQKNDVLLAKNGTTGVAALVEDNRIFDIYVTLALLRPNQEIIYPKYLLRVINSPSCKRQFDSHLKGIGVPNLHLKEITETKIPLPPLVTQKHIAAVLDKCAEVIAKHKLMLEKYDTLVKSQFVEMFGDPVQNPIGWEMSELGKQCTEVRYGTSKPAVENGKYPYLRMNNITYDGHLDLSNIKYIDIADDELPKCSVHKGDILFNRTNSIELCGKTCLYNLDEIMVIAGYIIRVRLNERLNPQYVTTFFNTQTIKKMLREMAKGAVNQANINAQEMQAIKIPVPPLALQQKFAQFVQAVDAQKAKAQKSLEKAEILYKALMQEYFG